MNKDRIVLFGLLGMVGIFWLVSAMSSQDIDELCETDGKILGRTSGEWQCVDDQTGGAESSYNSTYNNILNQQCQSGYIINGSYSNGTFICTQDQTGTNTANNSFNETYTNEKYLKLDQTNQQNITMGTPSFRGSVKYPVDTFTPYAQIGLNQNPETCYSGGSGEHCYALIRLDNPMQSYGGKDGTGCQIDNYDGYLRFNCDDTSISAYFDKDTGEFHNTQAFISDSGWSTFSGVSTDYFRIPQTTSADWFLKTDGTGLASWSTISTYETDPLFNAWLNTPPTVSSFTNDIGYMINGSSVLSDLFDVSETTPNDTNILGWDGNQWSPFNFPIQNTSFSVLNITDKINMIFNYSGSTTTYNFTTMNITINGTFNTIRILNDTYNFPIYNNTDLLSMWGFNNFTNDGDNATFFIDNLRQSNGTCVAASCPRYWNGQYYKNSLNFTTDFVTIQNSATRLDFTSASKFTVSLWIYPRSAGTYTGILTKSASGIGSGYEIGFDDTGKIRFITNLGTWIVTTGAIPLNQWQQITVVYNTNADVKMYWNGVQNITSNNLPLTSSSSYNLVLGRLYSNAATYEYDGFLDEVLIYNRALSSSEVDGLYKSRVGKYNDSSFELNTTYTNVSVCVTNTSNSEWCFGSNTTTVNTGSVGTIIYTNQGFGFTNSITTIGNITLTELLHLDTITLPSCSATIKNTFGANVTGTYGCNGTGWTKIF